MSVTLRSSPGKFKCLLLNVFICPDGITSNSGLTGPNNTIYIYIYIYILFTLGTNMHRLFYKDTADFFQVNLILPIPFEWHY